MPPTTPVAGPRPRVAAFVRISLLCTATMIGSIGHAADASAQDRQHAAAAQAGPAESLTVEQWREDLRSYDEQMRATHIDLFNSMSEEEFEAALADLEARLPELQRHEIIVELSRITAMVGDGHTALWLTPNTQNGFHQVPILLYWLQDGLYVLGVEKDHAAAVGGKVVRIGDVDVEEAMARVEPLVPRDNEMGVLALSPRYLEIPEVLHALRITPSTDGVTYVVRALNGSEVTVSLEAIPDGWLPRLGTRPFVIPTPADRVNMVYGRGTPERPQPMYLSDPGNLFWYEWLPDSQTLYVQLNAIQNKEDESMASFFERVFAAADSLPIDRLVIDLRFNGGGNNFNNFPVIRGIVRRQQIDQSGKLFVITSRHTFSAAGHLVTYLERQTDVIFVGEPTGASPNHYGDAGRIELPNSGLRAGASEIYWQNSLPSRFETRDWTPPEISAPLTIEDYLDGRDPAMEAILDYAAQPPIEEQLLGALESGGPEEAKATFRRYVSDPTHEFVNVEGTMNTLGYELLGQGKVDEAVAVFELNAEAYPESANVFDSLGDGYRAAGDTEAAIASYRKALEVDPDFGPSRDNLRHLLGQ